MTTFEAQFYDYMIVGGLVTAASVFIILFFITAPYGRHVRSGWGPTMSARIGWIVMESPAVVGLAFWFLLADGLQGGVVWILLLLWQLHYVHRAFIWPFRMKAEGKRWPVFIVLMAILFNLYNSYINGRYLGLHADSYTGEWLRDPRFILGVIIFLVGFTINVHSDQILFSLRGPGESGYKIPRRGMFRWISSPNYFGEVVEWTGWAIATWSLPGLVFALWTFANLAPRAHAHHKWYREKFPDYPLERRALIPFLF